MGQNKARQRFDQGVAIVTGGSGGIGAAITRLLVQEGSDVVFTYNSNRVAADKLVEELRDSGQRVESRQVSLEDPVAVEALLVDAKQRYGSIHSVIYAAGPSLPIKYVGGISADEWQSVFQLDTHACFNLVHSALPILKEQNAGSITAVTTTQFARHVPMSVLSSAPKAAIESMLQVVAREYGRYGVRANSVRSGWLDGGKFAHGLSGQVLDDAKRSIVNTIPLGMMGDPEDVADAVVFLSSQQARYITGEALSVDGGWKL
ncbi:MULTISPECIES: SDR family NAD(P)-dependent oxidoreductase [Pseudomonas]|uniref:SDR family NAD(P)-dependent oxidoreductase n=1 Tax=Pseudomonas TaxID=286 RepID=UPI000761C7A4|nr:MULTISPECIES: SDR family oxidoreductase [Pseudomonas]